MRDGLTLLNIPYTYISIEICPVSHLKKAILGHNFNLTRILHVFRLTNVKTETFKIADTFAEILMTGSLTCKKVIYTCRQYVYNIFNKMAVTGIEYMN